MEGFGLIVVRKYFVNRLESGEGWKWEELVFFGGGCGNGGLAKCK